MSGVKVVRRDGEPLDRLLKRFSGRIKSLKLLQKFRRNRYFSRTVSELKTKHAAISRENYRQEAKKKYFAS